MKHLMLSCLLLVSIIGSGQTNIIRNGGFEANTEGWRGDAATINPYTKKAGSSSGNINQFVGKDWKGIDQVAAIPKTATALEFSVWMKSDGIEGGKESYNAGIMTVEFLGSGDKSLKTENIAQVNGTTGWIQYKKTIAVPENAKNIRVMLALAQTSGSVFFDEVKAVAVSEEAYLKMMQQETSSKMAKVPAASQSKTLVNGNFEDSVYGWSGTGIISTTDKKEGNAAVAINSAINEWVALTQSADTGSATSIEISGWLKAKDIKQGKETWNNGMFIVEFTSDGKTKTTEDKLVGTVTGTTDWKFFKETFALPAGTKNYRIMLALSNATGTLLADDIKVRLLP